MTSSTWNPISVFIMNLKSFACFGKIYFVFTTTIIIVHTQSGSDRKILADRALANVEETCLSHWLGNRNWV